VIQGVYAKVYKFAPALKLGGETDLLATDATAIDITTDLGKKQAAAKKRYEIVMPISLWHSQVKAP
jgi:hypothetical protein